MFADSAGRDNIAKRNLLMQCYSGKTTRTIQLRTQIIECKTTATLKGSDFVCALFDHLQFYIGFRVQVIQYKTLMGLSQRYLKGGEKKRGSEIS